MKMNLTRRESSALYRLLADVTSDIILKTDCKGFILHASPAIERLGISLPNMLIGPHIQDLVHPSCAGAIEREHSIALSGMQDGSWMEFPTLTGDGRERWFEIQMRRLINEKGEVYGVLSIMRSIEERRAFQEQLFAASMTDPLTGLTNRPAFVAMLQHVVDQNMGGCLGLFGLDHLKAINMKFGQSIGDEALLAFAEEVKSRLRAQDIISRVSGESLGVLLPSADAAEAETICERVVAALGEEREIEGAGLMRLTASAGVARIAGSVDDTIKRAEMALFFAKASGRNRLGVDGKLPAHWSRAA